MSMKAARGTKRVCPSCGSKFYDLNRDPASCPICGAEYRGGEPARKATLAPSQEEEAEDDVILSNVGGVEFVALDEIAESEEDGIPGLGSEDLVPLEEEGDLKGAASDEAFLENEDDAESDIGGFIGGGSLHPDDDV